MNRYKAGLKIAWLYLLLISCVQVDAQSYQWAGPTRLVTAVCSKFSSVSDLPQSKDTVEMISKWVEKNIPTPIQPEDQWQDGTAGQFTEWLKYLEKGGSKDSLLILYFSSHQLKNGDVKFSKGVDLMGSQFVGALNHLAAQYGKMLFIDDSCYADALENCGSFEKNILRLYSSSRYETALDIEFERAPFGFDDFFDVEKKRLKDELNFNGKGLSFLGLIAVKAGFAPAQQQDKEVELSNYFKRMTDFRNDFNYSVRQPKLQRFELYPADANLTLLNRVK